MFGSVLIEKGDPFESPFSEAVSRPSLKLVMDVTRLEPALPVLETSVLPIALHAQRRFITLGRVVQGSTFF